MTLNVAKNIGISLIVFAWLQLTATAQLAGTVATCENEGEVVEVPLTWTDPCKYTCRCKSGQVVCEKQACPSMEGCHAVIYGLDDRCCEECKGCVYKNTTHVSGTSWMDAHDPCREFTCQAGVLSVTETKCYTPCDDPVDVKDQCCPVCEGCGTYKEGETFTLDTDICVQCTCKKNRFECFKRACPVLSCSASHVAVREGHCCPECRGTRMVFEVFNRCLLGNKIYNDGQSFQIGLCTSCTCMDSTSVCHTKACPPLDCAQELQIQMSEECCPKCMAEEEKTCKYRNVTYEDGQEWKLDACTVCVCTEREIMCHVIECPQDLKCSQGFKPKKLSSECCTRCVEDDAVCTVYGDPHYITFDGKTYNFQGRCKYVLAQDCKNKTFSVRAQNDARVSAEFAWTKMIEVVVNKLKIRMRPGLEVRVQRKVVRLPYIKLGLFSIVKDSFSIVLRTTFGVKVVWDGDSYAEITVDPKYKSTLCGLCGNYNGNPDDDFTNKRGKLLEDKERFGNSWKVGGAKMCKLPKKNHLVPPCLDSFEARVRAMRECNVLKRRVFSPCFNVVDPREYYKSCIQDMCDCPRHRSCACETVIAYAMACSRNGIDVAWQEYTTCGERQCQEGEIYDHCGPRCQQTCDTINHNSIMPACKGERHCIAGCRCITRKVLHNGRCIRPNDCPSGS
ncbi:PREDICTED: BMP-binding endothelial regulator protein-like [Priapulus caudatus]|uniref:BMP-binding endothelial regulator protein-like n=1 Tax=Priapulus caudatus TaxID=37621 RepID=A0ABM1ECA7_PRICU|nr:PREDICTED: BMP-binding endothelial regulator protein-like [Priapulus caudatus]